jgi:hypothetical protein
MSLDCSDGESSSALCSGSFVTQLIMQLSGQRAAHNGPQLWPGLMYAFMMRTREGGLLLVFARMVSHIILLSHLGSLVKIMFHNVCRVNGCQRQRKIHVP